MLLTLIVKFNTKYKNWEFITLLGFSPSVLAMGDDKHYFTSIEFYRQNEEF